MKNIIYLVMTLAVFFSWGGCNSKNTTDPIPTYDNIPVIVNTIDSYTFTLNADNLSLTRSDSLFFESDSLVATLTIGNYANGNGEISVSADSILLFAETLNSNKVVVRDNIIGDKPTKFYIQLSDFTGVMSFVLSAEDTSSLK